MSDCVFLNEANLYKKAAEEVETALTNGFQHMIKWKIQDYRQTVSGASWATSVSKSYKEIKEKFDKYGDSKSFTNYFDTTNFDILVFERAKLQAIDEINNSGTPYDKSYIPRVQEYKYDPKYFTLNSFRNINLVKEFMLANALNMKTREYIKLTESCDPEYPNMYERLDRRKNNL